jgi:hypothetical protein
MNGLKPAVDSPARFRKWVIKGRQQKVLPPFVIIKSNYQPATTLCGGKGGFPMTCTEEYKEHIEYTFHAFCKIVIRNASYTALRTWSRKHKREISLDYITDEKHYPLGTTDEYFKAPEPDEEYIVHLCGDTVILSNGLLVQALSRLPAQKQEMLYLSFFKRIFYQSEDENSGQFTYFAFSPDTMETTYHLEFRYAEDLSDLQSWFEGNYAYWNAAAIAENYDQATMENVIELFVTENLSNAE